MSPRPPARRRARTFCRICEAHCGLVATLEDGPDGPALLRLDPDREHPVSRGYTCVKGLTLGALHDDPDRLDHPMRREADGTLTRIDWGTALREIGDEVRRLRRDHGPRAIAHYAGNPTYFSFQNVLFASAFLEGLGSPNHFASHSIDVNPKFDVATQIYGLSICQPVPDLDRTTLFIGLGTNPMISQMSVVQVPDALGRLQAIENRGGRVVLFDPRRTETAKRVGEHRFIVPGTDAYLLLAMVHVLAEDGVAVDPTVARGVEALLEAAAPWSPERVAPITGVDAATVTALARAFRDADGACLYMSTGVNMGPFGSLAYWALQGLHLIAGQLDRPGGLIVPRGAFDAFALAKALGVGTADGHRSRVSGWHRVAGAFPLGALAEEIRTPGDGRIRALFVSAGNPAHSAPGPELREALEDLELLVVIDLYPSETARHAHYLLPATDMLERSDFPLSWTYLQDRPHAQYTPALLPAKHARRPEWRIFTDLALACGAPPFGKALLGTLFPRLDAALGRLGLPRLEPDHLLDLLLRWGGQTTLSELKAHPGGVPLAPNPVGTFLGHAPTTDGRIHLDAPRILADLPRLEKHAAAAGDEAGLVLIGRRQRKSHNSWMHNNRAIRHRAPEALLHPDEAARRDLADGDRVRVEGPAGNLELPLKVTEDVAPGVLVVPHGWGHTEAGLEKASALPGGNVNRVLESRMEPVSGQSILLTQRVTVARA
jgi:anaerobic selenocysteine-containing dehydrogenase